MLYWIKLLCACRYHECRNELADKLCSDSLQHTRGGSGKMIHVENQPLLQTNKKDDEDGMDFDDSENEDGGRNRAVHRRPVLCTTCLVDKSFATTHCKV
jgi:hypothetical protein